MPAGWLIQAQRPLSPQQINDAREMAANAGITIEVRDQQPSLSQLRTRATAAGLLLALSVLAMTVGLIRSEGRSDLATLAAVGATRAQRRMVTGATAGGLALLGALLGIAGAYLVLVAWYRGDLSLLARVPYLDLGIIALGLPLLAAGGGWLMASREPPSIARHLIE